jgi:hypothetical protein
VLSGEGAPSVGGVDKGGGDSSRVSEISSPGGIALGI